MAVRTWTREVGSLAVRHLIEPDDLDSEIVTAALPQRLLDDDPGGLVQIGSVIVDRLGRRAGTDMLVDAVGGEHENIPLDGGRLVVDLDRCIDAERAAEIGLL